MTRARAGAAAEPSSDQLLEGWAAEAGQGEHEDRQEAVRRMRALQEATANAGVPQSLEISVLSLTSLPAVLPTGLYLRGLHVGFNRLDSLPDNLPATLRELNANGNRLTSLPNSLPPTLRELDASDNRLSSLPDLPAGIRRLNVDDNQLDSLPDNLPATLEELNARSNRLSSLPETLPAGIRQLDAARNRLTALPARLPSELSFLSVSANELTSLPNTFPAGLVTLYADHNQLTSLPETLLTQFRSEGTIDLDENPLPDRVRTNLAAVINAADYAGPQVYFSMGQGVAHGQARPLAEAVADWLDDEPAAVAAWQGFAAEPGAQEYSRFLDRLRDTVSYGNDAFRETVAEDLRQTTTRPRLREQYFQLAIGASESCEDRITLTWNNMQTARLNADVEDGAYDERLDELLQQGRVMFRLDALQEIARNKVRSLRFVDEIEVYLAYQVKLREPLQLRHIAPDMRFFAVSHVTERDIAAAEISVRNQEATGFVDYLATLGDGGEPHRAPGLCSNAGAAPRCDGHGVRQPLGATACRAWLDRRRRCRADARRPGQQGNRLRDQRRPHASGARRPRPRAVKRALGETPVRLDPALVVDVPHLARGTRLYDGCMNRTVLIRLRRICGRRKTTKRLVIQ